MSNGSEVKNEQKGVDLSDYDLERLKEIEKMQKMLFNNSRQELIEESRDSKKRDEKNFSGQTSNRSETIRTPKRDSSDTSNKRLIEHANFIHDLSENNISPIDIISLYFIKHHTNNSEDNSLLPDSNFIPVTTNILKKDNDTIEITRVYLYTDYYNNKPYSTEKIVIKRNAKEKENIFISFFEDKMKKTITTVSADSIYTKVAKFKSFRNPNELLFFQNIFHYKCILDMYNYYKMMNRFPAKKDLVLNNLYYHEFMKNLI